MKSNAIKTTLLAGTMFLGVLAGCGADEAATLGGPSEPSVSPSSTNVSPIAPSVNPSGPTPDTPDPIIARTAYKPFADEHNDKFSLGDFDSPYLLRIPSGFTNFVASNSSILLNDITNEVTKTDYQGETYLGIDNFSFNDYTDFISTNAALTIKVNLVTTNGTYTLSNRTVMSGLMVTKATNLYTWQDLQGMKHNLAGGYQLMNDVTFPDKGSEGLPPEGFDPVGNFGAKFTGSFAGNNHTIVNLSIERPTRNHVGIWGYVDNANSVIKDFVLDHAGVRGNTRVGGVVGWLDSGMVSNVGVVSSQNRSVSGNENLGGLVGQNSNGTVNGYVTGAVSGTGDNVGGLAGFNDETVAGYATGAVSGTGDVGGLVGENRRTVTGYATGAVSGAGNAGGLVGANTFGGTPSGYWDIASSMRNNSAGGVGISAIANVVYDSGAGTYTDTKGTAAPGDDVEVFNNATFLMHFTLPGASETWPTLDAQSSSPQP